MNNTTPTSTTGAYLPVVPLPAGAVHAEGFEVRNDGRCVRFFESTRRGDDGVSVKIVGYRKDNEIADQSRSRGIHGLLAD